MSGGAQEREREREREVKVKGRTAHVGGRRDGDWHGNELQPETERLKLRGKGVQAV